MAEKTFRGQQFDVLAGNLSRLTSSKYLIEKICLNIFQPLASHDSVSDKVQTYSFDVHYSPTLDWAGKAENSSFDVSFSSIHIHETVIPQRVIGRFQKAAPETQQGFLFSEADPFHRAQERVKAIEAYQHLDKWKNRLIAGNTILNFIKLLQK